MVFVIEMVIIACLREKTMQEENDQLKETVQIQSEKIDWLSNEART